MNSHFDLNKSGIQNFSNTVEQTIGNVEASLQVVVFNSVYNIFGSYLGLLKEIFIKALS